MLLPPGKTRVVVTEDRQLCEFPFKHKDETHHKCTNVDRDRPWCATKTDHNNKVVAWGYCNLNWGKL